MTEIARRAGHSKLVYNKATRTIDTVTSLPECPYCGATTGLRALHGGWGIVPPEYTCEADFTPRDDGPCFDDLPAA